MDLSSLITLVAVLLFVMERLIGRRDVNALFGAVTGILQRADAERRALTEEFSRERAELLLRLQHPNVIVPPRMPAADAAPAPAEEDEYDMVGQVMPLTVVPDEDSGDDS